MKDKNPFDSGPSYYRQYEIQPIEFIIKNKLGFLEGNIIKYVCRYKQKNGVEDLLKAQHYLDFLIEQYDSGEDIND